MRPSWSWVRRSPSRTTRSPQEVLTSSLRPCCAAWSKWCTVRSEGRVVKLAAFPKCYMDELSVTRSMTVFDWIELATQLPVDGVEMYDLFLSETTPAYLERVRARLDERGLTMPMMCYSPDFTLP